MKKLVSQTGTGTKMAYLLLFDNASINAPSFINATVTQKIFLEGKKSQKDCSHLQRHLFVG